jgi:LysM repeat protein
MEDLYIQQTCPPNTVRYQIQAGDTLYGLARRYGTTVAAIIAVNPGLDPNSLQIGRLICIPRQPVYPSCPAGNYYVIRQGDTLYAISRRSNVSVNDLIAANPGINPNALVIGQVICIPAATSTICPTGSVPYTIKAGDTMYNIAVKHRIDPYAVLKANPTVDPNSLQIGQVICLPTH